MVTAPDTLMWARGTDPADRGWPPPTDAPSKEQRGARRIDEFQETNSEEPKGHGAHRFGDRYRCFPRRDGS